MPVMFTLVVEANHIATPKFRGQTTGDRRAQTTGDRRAQTTEGGKLEIFGEQLSYTGYKPGIVKLMVKNTGSSEGDGVLITLFELLGCLKLGCCGLLVYVKQ